MNPVDLLPGRKKLASYRPSVPLRLPQVLPCSACLWCHCSCCYFSFITNPTHTRSASGLCPVQLTPRHIASCYFPIGHSGAAKASKQNLAHSRYTAETKATHNRIRRQHTRPKRKEQKRAEGCAGTPRCRRSASPARLSSETMVQRSGRAGIPACPPYFPPSPLSPCAAQHVLY